MSEIPYYFDTPVPKYFRESGWFSNINTVLFVTWAFSKCSTQTRTVVHDHKEITLQPYEFITGRGTSSADSLLSVEAFRHQLNSMQKAGLLKKTPNSTPNRFTCYIWVTERFCKHNPQLNPLLTPNSPPTEPPQSRIKNKRSKEDHHHPYPSSFFEAGGDDEKDDDDDEVFSLNLKKHEEKTHIFGSVSMSRQELDECIAIKGSFEEVKRAVEYLTTKADGRRWPISNWPKAMRNWVIPENMRSMTQENEEIAQQIVARNPDYCHGRKVMCSIEHDRVKDIRGIVFEPSTGNKRDFVSFSDLRFKEKVRDIQAAYKMSRGSIKNLNQSQEGAKTN